MANAESDPPRKTLVWSNFVRNLKVLQRELAALQPAVIHGAVSAEDREAEIRRFRHDPDCLLLLANPAAMSEGLRPPAQQPAATTPSRVARGPETFIGISNWHGRVTDTVAKSGISTLKGSTATARRRGSRPVRVRRPRTTLTERCEPSHDES
jgi:hypothetical protein